jgi:uncharacterized protein YegL
MNEHLTEVVAILDKSGSMDNLTNDTIGGYNSFIKEQKEGEGEALLTTVLFNDKYTLLHDRINIKEVKTLTKKDYKAGGTTALLDALGKTISSIGNKLHNTAENERPAKVIFFIITDGEENASVEFDNEKIKEMVELQKNIYNWDFIFVGANIDAFSAASSIGIDADMAFAYDADVAGTASVHRAMSSAVKHLRKFGNVGDSFAESLKNGED